MKAIYIRTSTQEQEPENQIKDIELISGKEYELFKDKQSAWKDNIERENFERLKKQIKSKKINELYVWDLDRLFRNRNKLVQFFSFCKIYGCKIHSTRQKFLEELNQIPEPFNEIMHNMMLQIMGWMAEEESNRKSERIKLAVRKKAGTPTKSYKGNKWGRKTVSTQKLNQLRAIYDQNKTIREMATELNLSKSAVHKYLTIIKREKPIE